MSCLLNSGPDLIQSSEPPICRHFITNLSPDPFLKIQPRLIAGQILQLQSLMTLDEKIHLDSLMPARFIDIQPDFISPQPQVKLSQAKQESFSVSLNMPHQTLPSQKRRHPAKNIQPGAVLTGCRYPQTFSSFSPPYSQPRMERKARLVLKHHGFLRAQRLKFFLTPSKISSLPAILPEDTHNWHASVDIPIDASTSGPGGPSSLFQIAASNGPQASARPNGPDLIQTPGETSPDRSPRPSRPRPSDARAGRAAVALSKPPIHARLPYASRGSGSGVSALRYRRPILAAGPPKSAKAQQFLSRCMRPGFSGRRPGALPESPRDVLNLRLDSSCPKNIIRIVYMSNYLMRLY